MVLTVKEVNYSLSVFSDSLYAAASAATFQWLSCDAATGSFSVLPGETSAAFVAQQSGSYAVAINQNGCSDTSACYIVFPVGIEKDKKDYTLDIFPNPSNGILYVKGNFNVNEELKLSLYNVTGKQLLEKNYSINNAELNEILNLSHYPKGVYLLRLSVGENVELRRVVVQ